MTSAPKRAFFVSLICDMGAITVDVLDFRLCFAKLLRAINLSGNVKKAFQLLVEKISVWPS